MNEDFEKVRMENIQLLERQIIGLQNELAEHKPKSKAWTPIADSSVLQGGDFVKVLLTFNNITHAITIPSTTLLQNSETDVVTALIEDFGQKFIFDQFRDIISPEVKKLQSTVLTLSKAGKW